MIEIRANTEKSVLVVTFTGVVNASHYAQAILTLEQLVANTQPKGLLLDWTNLAGWSEEAESLRFLARLKHRSTFSGLAIIGDSVWEADVDRCQAMLGCSVRRFPPSDHQAAEDWLATLA